MIDGFLKLAKYEVTTEKPKVKVIDFYLIRISPKI